MSIIFPTEPAKVTIEPVPTSAEFISYHFTGDAFKIKAWMPSEFASYSAEKPNWVVTDEFMTNNCHGCDRYKYFEEGADSEDYCGCWDMGSGYLINEGCPLGHTLTFGEVTTTVLSHLVVEASYSYKGPIEHRLKISGDPTFNIHVCAGDFTEDGIVKCTSKKQAANVWGTHGNVCWGYGSNYPKNIREAITSYITAPFNNDLMRLDAFSDNMRWAENQVANGYLNVSTSDKFLCAGYDALMLIDGERDLQAFYTMLMAGFRPFPDAGHIMAIPLEQATIKNGDNLYFGYTTKEDSVGRKWYVSPEGYLIGQMNESFVKV